ncbi:MAG: fasciclin domain-containing protein [Ahrensia sp.]|nr:fasciclin domain-containing protein [Ahrensia sp.]
MKKSIIAGAFALMVAATSNVSAANIVETAASTGQFNTLIAAAKAAGLAGALSAPGNLTVFAPSDAAFAKLPKGTVESLLLPQNKHKLAAILKYHVLPRRLVSGQLPHGRIHVKTIKSGGDRTLAVGKVGHGVKVDNANVVAADIKTSNGVIHIIDSVLLPSS